MLLSTSEIDFFEENGYLLLRKVLEPSTVELLREQGDQLIEEDDPFFRMSDEEFDGFRNLLFLDQSFLKVIDLDVVLVPLLQIMGYNLHLSSVHLSYVRSRDQSSQWRGDWHTDIFGFEDDLREHSPRVSVKCAFALTDHETSNSGVTILLPGSHRIPVRPSLNVHDPFPPGATQLKMNAGDCLIFENRVRHSRGYNISGVTRKCVLVGYSYKWVIPLDSLDGFELPEESLSPVAKDLMPRPYGVAGNGALAELCERNGLPLRPVRA